MKDMSMKDISIAIGKAMDEYRTQQNITVAQLIERLGIGKGAYHRYRRHETLPTLDRAVEWAKLFNLSMDELCNFTHEAGDTIYVVWNRNKVTAVIQPSEDPTPEGTRIKAIPVDSFHPQILEAKEFSGVTGDQPRQAVIDALIKSDKLPLLSSEDPWLASWYKRKAHLIEMGGKDVDLLLIGYAQADGFLFDPWAFLANNL